MAVILLSCLIIPAVTLLVTFARHRKIEERDAYSEARARLVFQNIQPFRGKVALTPAPPNKALSVPLRLYVISKQGNTSWETRKVVSNGFEFGYFDGAVDNCYRIVEIQDDGVFLYESSVHTPVSNPRHEIFKMHWK